MDLNLMLGRMRSEKLHETAHAHIWCFMQAAKGPREGHLSKAMVMPKGFPVRRDHQHAIVVVVLHRTEHSVRKSVSAFQKTFECDGSRHWTIKEHDVDRAAGWKHHPIGEGGIETRLVNLDPPALLASGGDVGFEPSPGPHGPDPGGPGRSPRGDSRNP